MLFQALRQKGKDLGNKAIGLPTSFQATMHHPKRPKATNLVKKNLIFQATNFRTVLFEGSSVVVSTALHFENEESKIHSQKLPIIKRIFAIRLLSAELRWELSNFSLKPLKRKGDEDCLNPRCDLCQAAEEPFCSES